MLRTVLPVGLSLVIVFPVFGDNPWKAGVAKTKITPKYFMWMSGYAARNRPADGKIHELWAKALVFEGPSGRKRLLLTMDLVGIPREMSLTVCKHLQKDLGLKRADIILSCSHTHSGPVIQKNLNVMYFLDGNQSQLVEDYTESLQKKLVDVAKKASKNLTPATLQWGIGKATFAVNRRNNPERAVPKLRKEGKLKGPVDHDVPVLAVRNPEGKLMAVVFGYACHATVLSGYQWSGDYPGEAQLFLEKQYPGTTALFWAGCGGDQNPIPRRSVALSKKYGKELADAVAKVVKGKLKKIQSRLQTRYQEIPLPFAELPTREKLARDILSDNRYVANRAKLLLEKLKAEGKIRGTYPYPIQSWRFGNELTWVVLGGEVVVDYSLRLKRELSPGKTWVMGYANDVMAYVPSLRVLQEGGYEGARAMVYYGLPTVWSPKVEEMIVDAVLGSVEKKN